MKLIRSIITAIILLPGIVFSQKVVTNKLPFEDSTLQATERFTIMPYNRLIKSAGKVITYGDPFLENHALDVCVLPGKKNIAIEDRYGIAVVNIKTNQLLQDGALPKQKEWQNLISTYSGITSFNYKNKTFICLGRITKHTMIRLRL